MVQKITLGSNGIVHFNRMQVPIIKGAAKVTSSVRMSRLQKLVKSQRPNICIVRGEGIGDVIMTTPTIRAIKETFNNNIDITYATNTRYLDGALVKVLKYNPDISHIIERDFMDDYAFDLVISLHCPAIPYEQPRAIPPNRIDIFGTHAGITLKDHVPKYFIQEEEIEIGKSYLQTISSSEKIILVQPFSSSKTRSGIHSRLKESLCKLYREYGIKSVIIAHSSDSISNVLWDNVPGSIYLKDLDIRKIAGVMVHCDLVLCPDSSILHLAGALGVPTVGIFGPTPPQSRINRYSNAVALWGGKDLAPCPCWYSSTCPIHHTCWERLTSDMIVAKCVEHLQNTNKVSIVKLLQNISMVEIQTEII